MNKIILLSITIFVVSITTLIRANYPNLVITSDDVMQMREAITNEGRFSAEYSKQQRSVDERIKLEMKVPVPRDGGGGYTHEQHKQNYQLMFQAGVLYQISQDSKYANFVKEMLHAYSELYPTLPLHPARKENAQNPGKLFWQSLNEAVWLVYTIQAYDLIYETLSLSDKQIIESRLLKPYVTFLSDGQPSTFNKIHNHGTWATAGVGMAGYVLKQPEWVEKALYGLDKSGKGGFMRQLEVLFSPDGYYTEGPYYQRYALFPFVTFANAIANNEPERGIFEFRDGILLKAIDTTIQLSYNGLFFPINDAIKSKGIDTIELVHGVTIAYSLTGDSGYLDIAKRQDQIILSGDGLKVANALDAGKETPYQFKSVAFGDGTNGDQGALVVMRSQQQGKSSLLFKPASQGLGHGHFDKLTWQFYDNGNEIVSDYGAARFLNVEAKFGGRYLPENNTYAKQTVAHNTVVVDETSHFDNNLKQANKYAPELNLFTTNEFGSVAKANIDKAYPHAVLDRLIALINLEKLGKSIALDIFTVTSKKKAQYDLPLHYQGHIIDTNFEIISNSSHLKPTGKENGYQHLWLKATAKPKPGLARVTWLNDNGRFYTHTSLINSDENYLFTQIGANDPNFNLRNEEAFIRRVKDQTKHQFISVLEPHGDYNPSKEYTVQAESKVTDLAVTQKESITLVELEIAQQSYLIVINPDNISQEVNYQNQSYSIDGQLTVIEIEGN